MEEDEEYDAQNDKHKEEGNLKKYAHPLKQEDDVLFSIVNGQVADEKVNVADALNAWQLISDEIFLKGSTSQLALKLSPWKP